MINTLSKINLSKIGWEGGRSTSIWIMSLNILFFWGGVPLRWWTGKTKLEKLHLLFLPSYTPMILTHGLNNTWLVLIDLM